LAGCGRHVFPQAGKVAALNSLKGQVMKLSKGKANPALVGEILERKLKG
jgi:aspartyl-tRNA(Asn)/glutamyl-tRNA(Gln) amidotransferase subunit B